MQGWIAAGGNAKLRSYSVNFKGATSVAGSNFAPLEVGGVCNAKDVRVVGRQRLLWRVSSTGYRDACHQCHLCDSTAVTWYTVCPTIPSPSCTSKWSQTRTSPLTTRESITCA